MGKLKKFLFLDIDGVLNSSEWYDLRTRLVKRHEYSEKHPYHEFDPRAVGSLNKIIENTGCEIVLSSTWRIDENINEVLRHVGICKNIYGVTPHHPSRIRGREIAMWLDMHAPPFSEYAILDDDTDMLPSQESHFFRTDCFGNGLNEEIAYRVIDYLNRFELT